MLLLIDAGNTRVKWALADPDADVGSWYANGALLHAELSGLEEILRQHEVRRVWISNVAGDAMATQLAELLQASGLRDAPLDWFRAQARQAGVVNGYRDPEQLGCDRFASLLGARGLFPEQSLIIVTAGTATTIDALHASGQFLGGMILPGLGTMAQY